MNELKGKYEIIAIVLNTKNRQSQSLFFIHWHNICDSWQWFQWQIVWLLPSSSFQDWVPHHLSEDLWTKQIHFLLTCRQHHHHTLPRIMCVIVSELLIILRVFLLNFPSIVTLVLNKHNIPSVYSTIDKDKCSLIMSIMNSEKWLIDSYSLERDREIQKFSKMMRQSTFKIIWK